MSSPARARRVRHIVGIATLIVVGCVAMASAQSPATDKSYFGNWKLNLAKSKYENATPPKESVRTHEDRGGGVILVMTNSVNSQGAKTKSAYAYKLDSKEYPVGTGQPGFATISLAGVDPYTVTFTQYLDGKVTSTGRRTVSKDGKTMVIETKGTDAQGKAVSTSAFYDKQ